jgi:hypothetical protein
MFLSLSRLHRRRSENMETAIPRGLLLLSVLSLLSVSGCSRSSASETDGYGDGVSEPDVTNDDDDDAPASERDTGTRPPARDSGAGPTPPRSDAGNNADAASGADADAPVPNDDGGAAPVDGSVGPGPLAGSCGPAATVSAAELGDTKKLGPWKPLHVERTGPSGANWVYYPEGLGKDGLKHPVFQWGPGAGTGPSNYLDHLNLLASHGFVIISQPSTNSGKQALDWILKQNDTQGSMWYQKLDPDRVARGGHSMGALQSMSESNDDRLKLTVLVCGGASGGGGAANIDYPSIFLGGTGESGTRNFAGDYAEVKGLSVFVTHTMADHISCARDNMGPWVAFMRWQLCGEEEQWKQEFAPGGTYCKAPWEACKTKMF